MKDSLEWLLGGAIDYAGIYPPAALSLEDAVSNYAKYVSGPEAWIINRFVCPTDRLDRLAELLPKNAPTWGIAAIGSTTSTIKEDIERIDKFHAIVGEQALVESFEVRADGKISSNVVKSLPLGEFDACFLELPWSETLEESLHILAQVDGVGAKARTGGTSLDAYPTASMLARFIKECIDLDLEFKLTAGLHHALPTKDESTGATMHGFLNVLIAGVLAGEYDLSLNEIERILVKQDSRAFTFSSESIEYDEMSIDEAAIEDFRDLFISFGSCSIIEPLDDLAHLGLVAAGVGA